MRFSSMPRKEPQAVPLDIEGLSRDERTVLSLLRKIKVSHTREVSSRTSEITVDAMNHGPIDSSGFVTFKFFDGEIVGIEGES